MNSDLLLFTGDRVSATAALYAELASPASIARDRQRFAASSASPPSTPSSPSSSPTTRSSSPPSTLTLDHELEWAEEFTALVTPATPARVPVDADLRLPIEQLVEHRHRTSSSSSSSARDSRQRPSEFERVLEQRRLISSMLLSQASLARTLPHLDVESMEVALPVGDRAHGTRLPRHLVELLRVSGEPAVAQAILRALETMPLDTDVAPSPSEDPTVSSALDALIGSLADPSAAVTLRIGSALHGSSLGAVVEALHSCFAEFDSAIAASTFSKLEPFTAQLEHAAALSAWNTAARQVAHSPSASIRLHDLPQASEDEDAPPRCYTSVASDGAYLYLFRSGHGLTKVGSGLSGTLAGLTYARQDAPWPDNQPAHLVVIRDSHQTPFLLARTFVGSELYLFRCDDLAVSGTVDATDANQIGEAFHMWASADSPEVHLLVRETTGQVVTCSLRVNVEQLQARLLPRTGSIPHAWDLFGRRGFSDLSSPADRCTPGVFESGQSVDFCTSDGGWEWATLHSHRDVGFELRARHNRVEWVPACSGRVAPAGTFTDPLGVSFPAEREWWCESLPFSASAEEKRRFSDAVEAQWQQRTTTPFQVLVAGALVTVSLADSTVTHADCTYPLARSHSVNDRTPWHQCCEDVPIAGTGDILLVFPPRLDTRDFVHCTDIHAFELQSSSSWQPLGSIPLDPVRGRVDAACFDAASNCVWTVHSADHFRIERLDVPLPAATTASPCAAADFVQRLASLARTITSSPQSLAATPLPLRALSVLPKDAASTLSAFSKLVSLLVANLDSALDPANGVGRAERGAHVDRLVHVLDLLASVTPNRLRFAHSPELGAALSRTVALVHSDAARQLSTSMAAELLRALNSARVACAACVFASANDLFDALLDSLARVRFRKWHTGLVGAVAASPSVLDWLFYQNLDESRERIVRLSKALVGVARDDAASSIAAAAVFATQQPESAPVEDSSTPVLSPSVALLRELITSLLAQQDMPRAVTTLLDVMDVVLRTCGEVLDDSVTHIREAASADNRHVATAARLIREAHDNTPQPGAEDPDEAKEEEHKSDDEAVDEDHAPLPPEAREQAGSLRHTLRFRRNARLAHLSRALQRDTLIGAVLPLVSSILSGGGQVDWFTADIGLSSHLFECVQRLDRLVQRLGAGPADNAGSALYEQEMTDDVEEVVAESAHPPGRKPSTQVVRVPGATMLHVEFDPRSRALLDSRDRLVVFTPPHRADAFRVELSHRQPWPGQIVVPGDTAHFFFESPGSSPFGFRCTVTAVLASPHRVPAHWLLDLYLDLSAAAGFLIGGMKSVNTNVPEATQRRVDSLVDLRLLSSGPLSPTSRPSSPDSIIVKLSAFMQQRVGGRPMVPASNVPLVHACNSAIIATLLYHNPHLEEAAAQLARQPETDWARAALAHGPNTLARLYREANQLLSWIVRRDQAMQSWAHMVSESQSLDDAKRAAYVSDELSGMSTDALSELCRTHEVAFSVSDVAAAIEALSAEALDEDVPDPSAFVDDHGLAAMLARVEAMTEHLRSFVPAPAGEGSPRAVALYLFAAARGELSVSDLELVVQSRNNAADFGAKQLGLLAAVLEHVSSPSAAVALLRPISATLDVSLLRGCFSEREALFCQQASVFLRRTAAMLSQQHLAHSPVLLLEFLSFVEAAVRPAVSGPDKGVRGVVLKIVTEGEAFSSLGALHSSLSQALDELQDAHHTAAAPEHQCAFAVTGPTFVPMQIYECRTCGLVNGNCCCDVCARVCHKGHDIKYMRLSQSAYCDCGDTAHSSRPCKCLPSVAADKARMDQLRAMLQRIGSVRHTLVRLALLTLPDKPDAVAGNIAVATLETLLQELCSTAAGLVSHASGKANAKDVLSVARMALLLSDTFPHAEVQLRRRVAATALDLFEAELLDPQTQRAVIKLLGRVLFSLDEPDAALLERIVRLSGQAIAKPLDALAKSVSGDAAPTDPDDGDVSDSDASIVSEAESVGPEVVRAVTVTGHKLPSKAHQESPRLEQHRPVDVGGSVSSPPAQPEDREHGVVSSWIRVQQLRSRPTSSAALLDTSSDVYHVRVWLPDAVSAYDLARRIVDDFKSDLQAAGAKPDEDWVSRVAHTLAHAKHATLCSGPFSPCLRLVHLLCASNVRGILVADVDDPLATRNAAIAEATPGGSEQTMTGPQRHELAQGLASLARQLLLSPHDAWASTVRSVLRSGLDQLLLLLQLGGADVAPQSLALGCVHTLGGVGCSSFHVGQAVFVRASSSMFDHAMRRSMTSPQSSPPRLPVATIVRLEEPQAVAEVVLRSDPLCSPVKLPLSKLVPCDLELVPVTEPETSSSADLWTKALEDDCASFVDALVGLLDACTEAPHSDDVEVPADSLQALRIWQLDHVRACALSAIGGLVATSAQAAEVCLGNARVMQLLRGLAFSHSTGSMPTATEVWRRSSRLLSRFLSHASMPDGLLSDLPSGATAFPAVVHRSRSLPASTQLAQLRSLLPHYTKPLVPGMPVCFDPESAPYCVFLDPKLRTVQLAGGRLLRQRSSFQLPVVAVADACVPADADEFYFEIKVVANQPQVPWNFRNKKRSKRKAPNLPWMCNALPRIDIGLSTARDSLASHDSRLFGWAPGSLVFSCQRGAAGVSRARPAPIAGYEQRALLDVGDLIECRDTLDKWEPAVILEATPQELYITYILWDHRYDEWLSRGSDRLATLGTHTNFKPGQVYFNDRDWMLAEPDSDRKRLDPPRKQADSPHDDLLRRRAASLSQPMVSISNSPFRSGPSPVPTPPRTSRPSPSASAHEPSLPFVLGDVYGCYWSKQTQEVCFTKNGRKIPHATVRGVENQMMFPAVCLTGPGIGVRVNFGQDPFLFPVHRFKSREVVQPEVHPDTRLAELTENAAREAIRAFAEMTAKADTSTPRDRKAMEMIHNGMLPPVCTFEAARGLLEMHDDNATAAVLWAFDNTDRLAAMGGEGNGTALALDEVQAVARGSLFVSPESLSAVEQVLSSTAKPRPEPPKLKSGVPVGYSAVGDGTGSKSDSDDEPMSPVLLPGQVSQQEDEEMVVGRRLSFDVRDDDEEEEQEQEQEEDEEDEHEWLPSPRAAPPLMRSASAPVSSQVQSPALQPQDMASVSELAQQAENVQYDSGGRAWNDLTPSFGFGPHDSWMLDGRPEHGGSGALANAPSSQSGPRRSSSNVGQQLLDLLSGHGASPGGLVAHTVFPHPNGGSVVVLASPSQGPLGARSGGSAFHPTSSDGATVKMDSLRLGQCVRVKKKAKAHVFNFSSTSYVRVDVSPWVVEMDGLEGRCGSVVELDHRHGLVLIEFVEPRTAERSVWWLPAPCLQVVPEPPAHCDFVAAYRGDYLSSVDPAPLALQALLQNARRAQLELGDVLARRILVALSPHIFEAESLKAQAVLRGLSASRVLPIAALPLANEFGAGSGPRDSLKPWLPVQLQQEMLQILSHEMPVSTASQSYMARQPSASWTVEPTTKLERLNTCVDMVNRCYPDFAPQLFLHCARLVEHASFADRIVSSTSRVQEIALCVREIEQARYAQSPLPECVLPVSAQVPLVAWAKSIDVPDAATLLVSVERDAKLPHGTSLQFFTDEACTELVHRVDGRKSAVEMPAMSFSVHCNRLWMRCVVEPLHAGAVDVARQRNRVRRGKKPRTDAYKGEDIKVSLSVRPVSSKLSLGLVLAGRLLRELAQLQRVIALQRRFVKQARSAGLAVASEASEPFDRSDPLVETLLQRLGFSATDDSVNSLGDVLDVLQRSEGTPAEREVALMLPQLRTLYNSLIATVMTPGMPSNIRMELMELVAKLITLSPRGHLGDLRACHALQEEMRQLRDKEVRDTSRLHARFADKSFAVHSRLLQHEAQVLIAARCHFEQPVVPSLSAELARSVMPPDPYARTKSGVAKTELVDAVSEAEEEELSATEASVSHSLRPSVSALSSVSTLSTMSTNSRRSFRLLEQSDFHIAAYVDGRLMAQTSPPRPDLNRQPSVLSEAEQEECSTDVDSVTLKTLHARSHILLDSDELLRKRAGAVARGDDAGGLGALLPERPALATPLDTDVEKLVQRLNRTVLRWKRMDGVESETRVREFKYPLENLPAEKPFDRLFPSFVTWFEELWQCVKTMRCVVARLPSGKLVDVDDENGGVVVTEQPVGRAGADDDADDGKVDEDEDDEDEDEDTAVRARELTRQAARLVGEAMQFVELEQHEPEDVLDLPSCEELSQLASMVSARTRCEWGTLEAEALCPTADGTAVSAVPELQAPMFRFLPSLSCAELRAQWPRFRKLNERIATALTLVDFETDDVDRTLGTAGGHVADDDLDASEWSRDLALLLGDASAGVSPLQSVAAARASSLRGASWASLRWSLRHLFLACRRAMLPSMKLAVVSNVLHATATPLPKLGRLARLVIDRVAASALYDREAERALAKPAFRTNVRERSADTVFGQALTQLRGVPSARLRAPAPRGGPHVALNVTFKGEQVLGQAGPYRDFFSDLARELREPKAVDDSYVLELLVPTPNNVNGLGEGRHQYMLNPRWWASAPHLELYEFLGRLLGIAMRTRVIMALDLPSIFWKQLAGHAITRADVRSVDVALVENVVEMLEACESEEEFHAAFDAESLAESVLGRAGAKHRQQLEWLFGSLPGRGLELPALEFERRFEYALRVERAFVWRFATQTEAVRRGLCSIVPRQVLPLLSWRELEERVCGRQEIDLEMLKRHVSYGAGVSESSPHIGFFWETLEGFTQQQLRRFIKFCYAQERLPSTDAEFDAHPKTRMLIKASRHRGDPDQALPHADTCFFNIELPAYSSKEIMRERLLTVIDMVDWGMSGDGDMSFNMGMPLGGGGGVGGGGGGGGGRNESPQRMLEMGSALLRLLEPLAEGDSRRPSARRPRRSLASMRARARQGRDSERAANQDAGNVSLLEMFSLALMNPSLRGPARNRGNDDDEDGVDE